MTLAIDTSSLIQRRNSQLNRESQATTPSAAQNTPPPMPSSSASYDSKNSPGAVSKKVKWVNMSEGIFCAYFILQFLLVHQEIQMRLQNCRHDGNPRCSSIQIQILKAIAKNKQRCWSQDVSVIDFMWLSSSRYTHTHLHIYIFPRKEQKKINLYSYDYKEI